MDLLPVFAGRSEEGELYTLYKEKALEDPLQYVPLDWRPKTYQEMETFHLRLPDGEIWALAPGSVITTWDDIETSFWYMKIESEVWTGILRGSRQELMVAKIVDRNRDAV